MATAAPPKPAPDSAPNQPGWKPELHDIPLDAIEVGDNVRSAEALDVKELAASIAANGVRTPIRVADIGAGRYELVYGQRRVAAAKLAKLATIPAIVDAEQPERADRAVDQLLENLQRQDLNALDTAKAYRWLLDKGLTQRALSDRLGIAQPTIANTLAVLKQPEAIQAKVAAGELTRSHVEVLAKLPEAEREEVARRAVEHKLSTRDLEQEIDLALERQKQADRDRDVVKAVLPKAEKALTAAKLDKKTATLNVNNAALADALTGAGWTVAETPKQFTYIGSVDECATAIVQWHPTWGAQYTPNVTPICHDREHQKARAEASAKQRAKDEAKWKAQREEQERHRAAERAAKEQAREGIIARVLELDGPTRRRLELFTAMVDGWGDVFDAFRETVLVEPDEAEPDGDDDQVTAWKRISALSDGDVDHWLGRFYAEQVDELVEGHPLIGILEPAKKPAKKPGKGGAS